MVEPLVSCGIHRPYKVFFFLKFVSKPSILIRLWCIIFALTIVYGFLCCFRPLAMEKCLNCLTVVEFGNHPTHPQISKQFLS